MELLGSEIINRCQRIIRDRESTLKTAIVCELTVFTQTRIAGTVSDLQDVARYLLNFKRNYAVGKAVWIFLADSLKD